MSHSRSKGHRSQQSRPQETQQEWNRGRTPSTMNSGDEGYEEQERYGGQSGYGGSQGSYGSQGGYRSINYTDRFSNPRGDSDYQGSREYRDESRYGMQGPYGQQGQYGQQGRYGQPDWRSSESSWRMENRREDDERMPQYREGQPERGYRQWGNENEPGNMNRGRWEGGGWEGRWEGGMESGGERGQQRSNVTRFGQRREGQSSTSQGMPGRQSFAGRGPQGYKRSDERITEDINEELTQDPELDASDVTVEIKNGEVILKGSVPDRESKRRAEDIAESCSGVKDVLNQLRIKREGSSESDQTSQRDKSEDKRNKVAS